MPKVNKNTPLKPAKPQEENYSSIVKMSNQWGVIVLFNAHLIIWDTSRISRSAGIAVACKGNCMLHSHAQYSILNTDVPSWSHETLSVTAASINHGHSFKPFHCCCNSGDEIRPLPMTAWGKHERFRYLLRGVGYISHSTLHQPQTCHNKLFYTQRELSHPARWQHS